MQLIIVELKDFHENILREYFTARILSFLNVYILFYYVLYSSHILVYFILVYFLCLT